MNSKKRIMTIIGLGAVLAFGFGMGFPFLRQRTITAGNNFFLQKNRQFSDINPLAFAQDSAYQEQVKKTIQDLASCINNNKDGDVECVNSKLQEITRQGGARFALDVIEPLAQEYQFLLGHSHDLSHTAGNYSLQHAYGSGVADSEKIGKIDKHTLIQRIGRALVDCDGWGAFGCYHGVIEAGLSRLSPTDRTRVVRTACMENPLIQSKQYYINQCIHWFGHGMSIFTSQTLKETLAICEGLGSWESDNVQLCLSGVFHAGSVPGSSDTALLANVGRVYSKDDVYFPCLTIPDRFRPQCFSHVPGRTGTPDMKKVFTHCNNIPEPDLIKKRNAVHRCYNSGSNILLVNAEFNARQVVDDCHTYAPPEYRAYCYEGAVRYWILRDPLLNNRGPFEICENAEEQAKSLCYRGLGAANNENYFSPNVLETYCNQISEPAYAGDCRSLTMPD